MAVQGLTGPAGMVEPVGAGGDPGNVTVPTYDRADPTSSTAALDTLVWPIAFSCVSLASVDLNGFSVDCDGVTLPASLTVTDDSSAGTLLKPSIVGTLALEVGHLDEPTFGASSITTLSSTADLQDSTDQTMTLPDGATLTFEDTAKIVAGHTLTAEAGSTLNVNVDDTSAFANVSSYGDLYFEPGATINNDAGIGDLLLKITVPNGSDSNTVVDYPAEGDVTDGVFFANNTKEGSAPASSPPAIGRVDLAPGTELNFKG
jgi:hypothetical protein